MLLWWSCCSPWQCIVSQVVILKTQPKNYKKKPFYLYLVKVSDINSLQFCVQNHVSLASTHFSEVLILQKNILLPLASERGCKINFATAHTTNITHLRIHQHLFPHQFREELFKLKEFAIQPLKEKNPGLPVTTQIIKSAVTMGQVWTKPFPSLPHQKGRELTG